MMSKLFPIDIYLNILQLEEYSLYRFYKWFIRNVFTRSLEGKKPLVVTQKIKVIKRLALLTFVLLGVYLAFTINVFGLLISAILLTQYHLFISLGLLLLMPYEFINRILIKNKLRAMITGFKKEGLKVIGITGSYGKTSVKETLYQILKEDYKVLRTPGSYNTLFGIKKVVETELDGSYDFFICEMGAYIIGEIQELCDTFLPDYAILTGINEQHIERFGSIENTIKAKFELPAFVDNKDRVLLNFDNNLVKERAKDFVKNFESYGVEGKTFKVTDTSVSKEGSKFNVETKNEKFTFDMKLVGNSKISNTTAAISMAHLLGMKPSSIKEAVSKLEPVPHRLEIKELADGTILIDDAYSANVTGFYEALDVLTLFKNKTKVVVTPGIVELGKDSDKIHKELGTKISDVADFVVLVGENARTKSINLGLNGSKKVFLDSINDLWDELKLRYEMGSDLVVLLENDLPDNY